MSVNLETFNLLRARHMTAKEIHDRTLKNLEDLEQQIVTARQAVVAARDEWIASRKAVIDYACGDIQ